MQIFLGAALGRRVDLVCLEDNTQCLGAVKSGYSAALRSLPRTERISLSVAHETFLLTPGNEIRHQPTDTHKGDVFTKRMEPTKFETALDLLGLRAHWLRLKHLPRPVGLDPQHVHLEARHVCRELRHVFVDLLPV